MCVCPMRWSAVCVVPPPRMRFPLVKRVSPDLVACMVLRVVVPLLDLTTPTVPPIVACTLECRVSPWVPCPIVRWVCPPVDPTPVMDGS